MSKPDPMAPFSTGKAFRKNENHWQGLDQGDLIPDAGLSPSYPRLKPAEQRKYGPGIGAALYLLLTGQAKVALSGHHITVTLDSGSGAADSTQSVCTDGHTYSGDVDRSTVVWAALIADAMRGQPHAAATRTAVDQFLALVGISKASRGGAPTPASTAAINRLASTTTDPDVRHALMQVSEACYWDLKTAFLNTKIAGDLTHAQAHQRGVATHTWVDLLRGLAPLPTAPAAPRAGRRGLIERVMLAFQRGAAVLLIGPSGTFKTESVLQAALRMNARLFVVEGAPGVSDRDMIGGIFTTPQSTVAWVDGMITRAVASAQTDFTLLLLDELMRLEPEALQLFIGLMNDVTGHVALSRGVPPELVPDLDARYYVLFPPNGGVLCAPRANLAFAFTTNVGDDFNQTAGGIDGAMRSRIDAVIEVPRADPETVRLIYLDTAGGDLGLVAATEALVEYTVEQATEAALLERALDPRKGRALIRAARQRIELGDPREEAFDEAVEECVLGHCCPRDSSGRLSEVAETDLLGEIKLNIHPKLGVSALPDVGALSAAD